MTKEERELLKELTESINKLRQSIEENLMEQALLDLKEEVELLTSSMDQFGKDIDYLAYKMPSQLSLFPTQPTKPKPKKRA